MNTCHHEPKARSLLSGVLRRPLKAILIGAITPLLEKNAVKTLSVEAPFVLSMTRLIVLSFAVAMLRTIWRQGIAAWPDATLSIAIVLALPMMGAIERAKPTEVIELGKALLGRFGIGSTAPSKFDDHRAD